jgi:hypothetical protein
MKRALGVVVLLLTLVTVIGAVSAETIVTGVVYDATQGTPIVGVSDADVTVTCNGYNEEADSGSDGSYQVTFTTAECDVGDSLSVHAEKGSLSGSATGTVQFGGVISGLDVGVLNVPLVPEFGLVVGSLTVVSAVAVFFLIRRR